MSKRKRRTDAVFNYLCSIPKGVKHIGHKPVMVDGVCVSTLVSYEINGAVVEKRLPNPQPAVSSKCGK